MKTTKSVKKLKENITQKEYKILQAYIIGNSMRTATKQNYNRIFTLLFFSGCRLNEVQAFRVHHIIELLETGTTIITTSKTNDQRKIYLSDAFKKELNKYFIDVYNDDVNCRVIYNTRNKFKMSGFSNKSLIDMINDEIHKVLGLNYSSHSFRKGLLTEMAGNGTNLAIMKQFINHKNLSTTARYVNATDEQIMQNIAR